MRSKVLKTMTKNFLTNLLFLMSPIIGWGVDFHNLADAVAVAESNNNPQAVGDSGKARGAYQMWKVAWDQTNKVRRTEGMKQYPWSYAHDAYVSKQYAIDYLRWCARVLEAKLGRKPVYWEIYAAYARGPSEFADGGYSYHNLPARTHRAIKVIATQMKELPPR
jgi:hypothetical protein